MRTKLCSLPVNSAQAEEAATWVSAVASCLELTYADGRTLGHAPDTPSSFWTSVLKIESQQKLILPFNRAAKPCCSMLETSADGRRRLLTLRWILLLSLLPDFQLLLDCHVLSIANGKAGNLKGLTKNPQDKDSNLTWVQVFWAILLSWRTLRTYAIYAAQFNVPSRITFYLQKVLCGFFFSAFFLKLSRTHNLQVRQIHKHIFANRHSKSSTRDSRKSILGSTPWKHECLEPIQRGTAAITENAHKNRS